MKLSWWTWIIVGVSIAIAALSFAYFKEFEPNMQSAQNWKDYGDELQTQVNNTNRAVERRQRAVEAVQQIGDEWASVVARKTPPANVEDGGINLAVNRWQLTVDARKFRDSVQRDVNRQMRQGGITVVTGPVIPMPGDGASTIMTEYFNFPVLKFPVCLFNLGTVTVRGNWNQIRENVMGWSEMPEYLAMTDGLTVTGTSPNLTATYNLVVVAYIQGGIMSPLVPEGNLLVPAINPDGSPAGGAPGAPGANPAAPAPGGGPSRPAADDPDQVL